MQRQGLNGSEIDEIVRELKAGKTFGEAMQRHGTVDPEWAKANRAGIEKLAGAGAKKEEPHPHAPEPTPKPEPEIEPDPPSHPKKHSGR